MSFCEENPHLMSVLLALGQQYLNDERVGKETVQSPLIPKCYATLASLSNKFIDARLGLMWSQTKIQDAGRTASLSTLALRARKLLPVAT